MNRYPGEPLPAVGVRTATAGLARVPDSEGPLLLRFLQSIAELRRAGTTGLRERAEELRGICRQACELHGIDVEVVGQFPEQPAVLVSNHLGYIDPVVLCSLAACSPIAKSEINAWPLVGEPLARMNVSFVRRGAPHSGARVLKQSLKTLRGGVSVLNFPEGTTSRGGLLPFQLGAFWLARRSGAPIVPIGMEFETPEMCWVDDEGFLPHYGGILWGRVQGRRLNVRVCIGEAIDPAQFQSEIESSWAARGAISALRRPYAAGAAPR